MKLKCIHPELYDKDGNPKSCLNSGENNSACPKRPYCYDMKQKTHEQICKKVARDNDKFARQLESKYQKEFKDSSFS